VPDFNLTDFLLSALAWWVDSPGVVSLSLLIACVVAWIGLVRWLENRNDLSLVQRHRKAVQEEIDAAKREREADKRRRALDAVTRISDRRRG